MNKTEALWEVMDAARETVRAKRSGADIAEAKRAWRAAIYAAIAVGATEKEIGEAEREGQS